MAMDDKRDPDIPPPPPTFSLWKLGAALLLSVLIAYLLYVEAEAALALPPAHSVLTAHGVSPCCSEETPLRVPRPERIHYSGESYH
jgi:hypothetical protein